MKSRHSGFTLIEVMVTIVAMVVLLTLGVVGLGNVQTKSRDKERASDIAVIKRGLEGYYTNGNPRITEITQGSYPGSRDLLHIMGTNTCTSPYNQASTYYATGQCQVAGGYAADVLPGVTESALLPPGQTTKLVTSWNCDDTCLTEQANNGLYAYRPYNSTGTAYCYENCPRYELWYRNEESGTKVIVKSDHQ